MRRFDRVLMVSVGVACLGWRPADGADAAPPPPTEVKPAKAPPTPSRSETYAPRLLECEPPADCPIPRSKLVDRIMLTGRYVRHGRSDNVYPAWADDGTAYSGFADGDGTGKERGQGLAQWIGNAPFHLKKETLGFMGKMPNGYYPCFSLVHRGIYYYGIYGAHGSEPPKSWPFMGFCTTKVPIASTQRVGSGVIDTNLWKLPKNDNYFGEQAPFRFRVPRAVDMGLNLEYSPDGKAYMVSHGSTRRLVKHPKDATQETSHGGFNDWGNGDAVFLVRFTPDPKLIHAEPPQGFEFWAGKTPEGLDRWAEKVTEAQPMVRWDDHLGALAMSYLPATKRWWLVISKAQLNFKNNLLMLLEAPQPTGPWSLCAYVRAPEGMIRWWMPAIPVKYHSNDPSRMWIILTGTLNDDKRADSVAPQAARDAWPAIAYGACFIEFVLLKPGETPPTSGQLAAADAAAKERKP
jgi:hypothetical protein